MDGEAGFTVGAQGNEVLFENASAVLAVLQHRGDRSTEALSKLLRLAFGLVTVYNVRQFWLGRQAG